MTDERDVSPSKDQNGPNDQHTKKDAYDGKFLGSIDRFEAKLIKKTKELSVFLFHFLKNPILNIKTAPNWGYKTSLFVLMMVAALSGALYGIITRRGYDLLAGLILMPLTAPIVLGVGSLFFYYSFQIIFNQTVDFKKLLSIIVLANLPFFIFQTVSHYIPPITLVGHGFTSFLLIVGFSENFHLPKKRVMQLVGAIYSVIVLVWIYQKFDSIRWEQGLGN
jgi:hypothetical protein